MRKIIEVIPIQREYKGIGYIKSRKSDSKIMDMATDMKKVAYLKNIELVDVIVDSSSGRDVDREELDELVAWMEKDYIDVVVLKSIFDISKDDEELLKFLRKADALGVSVYSLEHGVNVRCVPEDAI